jgi:serine/threonine protein kinase
LSTIRLGKHELLIRLASGGAANVFLVRDLDAPPPGRLLALKILLPSLASNEDFLNMFFTEARIAGKLQHNNVVAIAGFGAVDGIHCLAMEYVFGASLAQVLRASARAKKPLTVGVLLRITATVCDALHYAHELLDDETGKPMGLVHRDVTPQNILIGFNGVPKLTDFGIAKATNRGWETQAGIVKGKFSYMSPEQALGKKVDRRSDIFGTGIVLWEALTGRDLFRGSTPMEVLTAIREQKIEPPSKVVPGLTPIVDPIVMKALQRSPRRRYSSALEMKNEIEDLIRRAGVDIDSQIISREFAAIYGDEIVERAFALRAAMAGKPDLPHLAKTLGGSVLNPKHLPVIPGGVTDPDPLGLFNDTTPASPGEEEIELSVPARTDRSFSEAAPVPDDFEIIEGQEDDEPQFEVAFDESPAVPEERIVSGWDDSTAMAVPDDELLSMLSEEDATIGYLPPEFAERFGQELQNALEDDVAEFEDELTVGMPEGPALQRLRSLHGDDDSMSGPWDEPSPPAARARAATKSLRPIPRAPSLDMRYESRGRPVPRAPSLDMEVDDTRTPLPKFGTTYDPVAEPPLPSRAPPRTPPPPPRPPSMGIEDRPTLASGAADASTPLLPVDELDRPSDEASPLPPQAFEEAPMDAVETANGESPLESDPPEAPELALKPAPTNGRVSSDLLPPPPAGGSLSPESLRALAADPAPSSPGLAAARASSHVSSDLPHAAEHVDPLGSAGLSTLPPPPHLEKKSGVQVSVGMLIFLVLSLLALGAGIGLLVANKV